MTRHSRDFELEAQARDGPVTLRDLAPVARFSLRAGADDAAAAGAALGLDLGGRIGSRAGVGAGGREALRLGPDEWVVTAPEPEAPALAEAMAAIHEAAPHAFVDLSDRELSLAVEGPLAAELLAIGCPRDLERIAPGEGRRTLFDTVQVVLWRDAPDRFRLDVWRSFHPHVRALLEIGNAELAAEHGTEHGAEFGAEHEAEFGAGRAVAG